MLTAGEISDRLARIAEEICRELLPNGRVDGGNWRVGSLNGEKGKSLGVQLTGARAGVWADFAGGEGGDLLDLWAKTRNISLGQAIKEAKERLKISDPIPANPRKVYARPKFTNVTKLKEKEGTDTERYLITDRKLKRETIHAFRVGEIDRADVGKAIVFPSRNPEGEWIAAKYIALKRGENGKKIIWNEKDQAPCLFGWQTAGKGCRRALITEGQIDAMTWHQWVPNDVIACFSIPNGTGDPENWIDVEWDNLAQFDLIYLSFDMDDAGRKAVLTVAKRLGTHRCMIVRLPHNDANECLQKGCTEIDAAEWLKGAKPLQPSEIKSPMDFRDRIKAMENPDPNQPQTGFCFSVLGPRCRFVPGDVTMWTGYSFHGKSTLLSQLAIEAAIAGQGVAIASFEMPGELTCAKLAKCLTFRPKLSDVNMDSCLHWMGGKIWIYDVMGIITQAKLFELMTYSVMRHGVKQVIIDSLMKCDISSEDYEAQRLLLNKVIGFAITHELHVHIVAHPRKAEDDKGAPDVMDIHGGQAVSGQPGNIISVWKNSKKADKREDGTLPEHDELKHPDTVAYVRKNRVDGNRYKTNLWFNRKCFRFTEKTDDNQPFFTNYNAVQLEEEPTQ